MKLCANFIPQVLMNQIELIKPLLIAKSRLNVLQEIIRRVKASTNYSALLEYDQLRRAQIKREAFVGFSKLNGFTSTLLVVRYMNWMNFSLAVP